MALFCFNPVFQFRISAETMSVTAELAQIDDEMALKVLDACWPTPGMGSPHVTPGCLTGRIAADGGRGNTEA